MEPAPKTCRKASAMVGCIEIRSPNAGVVKDLTVTTRGAVVAAGGLLLNVVPVEEDPALRADDFRRPTLKIIVGVFLLSVFACALAAIEPVVEALG